MKLTVKSWYAYLFFAISLGFFTYIFIDLPLMPIFANRWYYTATLEDISEMLKSTINGSAFAYNFALISSVILLITANIYYWQSGFVKLFWLCLFYFTLTTIAYFWLLEQLFLFEKSNGLWEGGFSVTIVVAPVLILAFSVLLYINYLIIRYAKNRKTQRA